MHLSYSVAKFLKMIPVSTQTEVKRKESQNLLYSHLMGKGICKMRVYSVLYRLTKDDATLFVHKMGMVVFLTLIAMHFV